MTAARCAACCVWYWQAVWRVAVKMRTGEEAGEKGLTSGGFRHNVNLTIKRLFNGRITQQRSGRLGEVRAWLV